MGPFLHPHLSQPPVTPSFLYLILRDPDLNKNTPHPDRHRAHSHFLSSFQDLGQAASPEALPRLLSELSVFRVFRSRFLTPALDKAGGRRQCLSSTRLTRSPTPGTLLPLCSVCPLPHSQRPCRGSPTPSWASHLPRPAVPGAGIFFSGFVCLPKGSEES